MSDDIYFKTVKKIILESKKPRIKISSGRIVEKGSKRHIRDLDRLITELDVLRRESCGNNRAYRKERYTISRCIESIRNMKRKFRKEGIKKGLLDENDV